MLKTYQESFTNFLTYEKRHSTHTVTAYKNDLDQFVQFCTIVVGEFNVKKISNDLVRGWGLHLMENGNTPKTVRRKIATLRALFKFLMITGIITEDPTRGLILPKVRKKLPYFVEEKRLAHLLDDGLFSDDFKGTRNKLIIALLYGTGVRLSELLNLKDSDIDTNSYLIKVLGKRKKERIIPYPRSINTLLNQYFEIRDKTIGFTPENLLVTEKGKKIYEKLIYRVVTTNLEKVTSLEKKSPHILRHTYATHLLNRGADLNAVKELLGHSNLSATQIYTHITFDKMHNIYKQAHPRG